MLISAHFLFMGPAKTDQAKSTIGLREDNAVALAIDPAKGTVSDLAIVEPVIHTDFGVGIETCKIFKRQPMLGHVQPVFCGVPGDFHLFNVDAI